ncbi:MAG: HD domain-containing phosphohydrolase [Arenicellales bacterium]|nr:HD domain-containing phosphohydrolase [Arenicellales bacterium]
MSNSDLTFDHEKSMAWVCDGREISEQQLQNTLSVLLELRAGEKEQENVDWFTLSHARLLMDYTDIILSALRVDKDWSLKVGVGLHDVGKMTVPAHIWLKGTSLTGIERAYAEKHAKNGYELLKKNKAGEDIARIALLHHERLDGHGYPKGLVKDEIPLAARVASVIDVFDALVSPRHYKEAWGLRAVVDYLEIHRNGWFDANVVDALVDNVDVLLKLRTHRTKLS